MSDKSLTVGIVGGGQLGMMLAEACKKLGLRSIIFSDQPECPASITSDQVIVAPYDNKDKLTQFAAFCDVVTYEFENIPIETIEFLESKKTVLPDKIALKTFQNRVLEKEFLCTNDIPCAAYEVVRNKNEFAESLNSIGLPCILKTAGMGYDGKGQFKLKNQSDADSLLNDWIDNEYVLEEMVDLAMELSVVASRDKNGLFKSWGVIENEHRDHILHISIVPGRVGENIASQAEDIARTIAEKINYHGVFCTEFFLTKDDRLLVNEIAPRVHNSGHLTIEAFKTSQFEQHIRAVSGMPLEDTILISPAAMLNILGDLMIKSEPDWKAIEIEKQVKISMYGKKVPKPGRKMGHLTLLAENADIAYKKAEAIYKELSNKQR